MRHQEDIYGTTDCPLFGENFIGPQLRFFYARIAFLKPVHNFLSKKNQKLSMQELQAAHWVHAHSSFTKCHFSARRSACRQAVRSTCTDQISYGFQARSLVFSRALSGKGRTRSNSSRVRYRLGIVSVVCGDCGGGGDRERVSCSVPTGLTSNFIINLPITAAVMEGW